MSEQEGRLYVYRLLKILFEQPLNRELLELLGQEPDLRQLARISSGAQQICSFLDRDKDKTLETCCKELHFEYQRLFVGPGPVLVPIWESVYFDPEHLMFGDRTLEVREKYQKYNLQFIHKNHQPEDHLAIELEFMCFLIEQYLDNQNDRRQEELLRDQKAFFMRHLSTWKDDFYQFLEKSTECQLYKGAGQLLKEFLELELNMFEHLEEVG